MTVLFLLIIMDTHNLHFVQSQSDDVSYIADVCGAKLKGTLKDKTNQLIFSLVTEKQAKNRFM